MKKLIKWMWLGFFGFLIAGLIWNGINGYKPSRDGHWEEEVALEDMKDQCNIQKLDCSDLRIVDRSSPVPGDACTFPDGEKSKCERTNGFWSFIVRLKTGAEYSIVVLPGDIVFVGPFSQIHALDR